MFDGETAFTLYDTYGFPLDLTQDALRSRGIGVDLGVVHRRDGAPAREGARVVGRARARRRPKRSGFRCAKNSAPPSSSATRPRPPKASSRHWSRMARKSRSLEAGESGAVVLNQTPFYGESGGQVGDTGVLVGEGVRFRVTDTQKKARRSVRPSRQGRAGHAEARRDAVARGRSCAADGDPRQPLGDASVARGAAPGARRSHRPARLAGRARPAALRLRRTPSRFRRTNCGGSRTSPTTSCSKTARSRPG